MKWFKLTVIAAVLIACTPTGTSNQPAVNPDALACRHCHHNRADPTLITALNQLQTAVGHPLVITSGYRCPTHNRSIGGACHSWHLVGLAADIRSPDLPTSELALIAEALPAFRDGGIGVYPNHVHVDLRPAPARWGTWSNKPKEKP